MLTVMVSKKTNMATQQDKHLFVKHTCIMRDMNKNNSFYINGERRNPRDSKENIPKRSTSNSVRYLIRNMTTVEQTIMAFIAKSRVGAPMIAHCTKVRENRCKANNLSGFLV